MSVENGVWRTISGRRVFIKDGQSLTDAMRESGKFSKKQTYYRGTNRDTPMSDWGHAMFADSYDAAYTNMKYVWEYDGADAVDVDSLAEDIREAWNEDLENEELPQELRDITAEEVVRVSNPEDIVDSAGLYDNGDLVEWFWNRVLEPKNIMAIKTNDGAIVFDEDLIRRGKKKE